MNEGTDEEKEELKQALSNARKQSSIPTLAGQLGTNVALYGVGSKAMQAIPAISNLTGKMGNAVGKKAGEVANLGGQYLFDKGAISAGSKILGANIGKGIANSTANILGDTILDVALDTVPTTIENVKSGMSVGEVAKEAGKNIGTNLAFNVGGEAISNALPALKKYMNNRTNSIDAPTDLEAASENIVKQIKDYANGTMESGSYIDLGKTPEYLNNIGNTENPFMMKQSTVYKTAYPEGYLTGKHNLGYEPFKQIPYQLGDPVAVMKSTTQPNSAVVVTDMIDENGYPVIMPIHMDKNGRWGVTNELASLYGKRNIDKMIENAEKSGNIISINKERANAITSKHGLQLPDMKSNADPIFDNSISNTQKNINSKSKTTAPKGKLILYPAILRKFILFTFSLKFFKLSTLAGGTYSFLKNV